MPANSRCRAWNVIGLLVLVFLAVSGLRAETRMTLSRAPLHLAPTAGSRVVATVPAGVRLSVSSCSKTWCETSWNGTDVWVPRRYLGTAKSERSGRGYINSDGKRIPSPQMSPSGPPAGATAQCNDGSYSFSTHRSGTCSHHGGVRRWL
ncbi:MAG TPA: DUF3761 domain-containing protein [Thermoanaerobaculia bacterium]